MLNLKNMINHCIEMHMYTSAQFFADKLVSISGGELENTYLFAQTLFLNKEYHRAHDILERSNAIQRDQKCLYLAAKCKAEIQQWDECLEIIGDTQTNGNNLTRDKQVDSAICLLRGKAYDALENRARATHWYIQALEVDPYCMEALDALTSHHMLTSSEEQGLLSKIQNTINSQSNANGWIASLYACLLKKYDTHSPSDHFVQTPPLPVAAPVDLSRLAENTDVIAAQAEFEFYANNFREAHLLTKKILQNDPYNHGTAVAVHISSLVELKLKTELFYLCHKLVEGAGHTALAWYGVGSYYFLLQNFDSARRYFSKATTIDPHFGPAWMGFGHSFAAQAEHDQAMAAYRTAVKVLSGSHHPPLSIAMELIRVQNLPLAEQYLLQAKEICATDPLVYNELGVIYYMNCDYKRAVEFFLKVLELCVNKTADSWESTLFNLGNCYRKLRDYPTAIQYYAQSLNLNPDHASTYMALGYAHHLNGDVELAIDYYHQSLSLNDDSLTTTLLTQALEDLCYVPVK